MNKGIIGIDIDGTLTANRDMVPREVVTFLTKLHNEGWHIHFVTGRTPAWSFKLLQIFHFPFTLSSLNGAITFEMPSKNILHELMMPKSRIKNIFNITTEHQALFGLYPAYEKKSPSYLLKSTNAPDVTDHVEKRSKLLEDTLITIDSPDEYPFSEFLAGRVFVRSLDAKALSIAIESKLSLHAPRMTDSTDSLFSVIQVIDTKVSKGESLEFMAKHLSTAKLPIIACGDDYNDITMLEIADCAVVMSSAPPDVQQYADVIAPPAERLGIIQGIEHAIQKLDFI